MLFLQFKKIPPCTRNRAPRICYDSSSLDLFEKVWNSNRCQM